MKKQKMLHAINKLLLTPAPAKSYVETYNEMHHDEFIKAYEEIKRRIEDEQDRFKICSCRIDEVDNLVDLRARRLFKEKVALTK